mmetsp:Transcript_40057/g.60641  ORF Transcript_40057/g.60641 Transcript_40057/m.60641 type:complete len:370 (+) Transcript_40057:356-1465(+)
MNKAKKLQQRAEKRAWKKAQKKAKQLEKKMLRQENKKNKMKYEEVDTGIPPSAPSPPITMDPEMIQEEAMVINEAEKIMEEEEEIEEEMNEIQEEYVDIDMDDVAGLEDDLIFEELETFVGAGVKPIPFATLLDGVRFEVLETLPHDPTCFTQGLSYNNGILYESTGLNGKSKVRRLDATTLDVIQSIDIPRQYFGEGIAYHNGNLVQITWKKRRGFVYDANDLSLLLDFPFETEKMEGWGITHDAIHNRFVVSDGSQYLHFWDDQTLEEVGERVKVWRLDGSPAKDMNELEFWRGKVLANVWYEDTILVINAVTGFVESEYDFSSLWPKHERKKEGADVLNGISISQDEDVLFVTGKFWKYMFKVRLI